MSERKLTIEERVEALETKIQGILLGFITGLEEAAKIDNAELAQHTRPWDPSKIKWEEAQGQSGIYEKSADVNNIEFKNMLKDLGEHQGKLTRNEFFYWTFKNGTTVGRKKRKY